MAGIDFCEKGDGIDTGNGIRQIVRYWQRLLRRLGAYGGTLDGIYGEGMQTAVQTVCGGTGEEIGNKNAYLIHRAWIVKESTDVVTQALADFEPPTAPPPEPGDPVLVPHTHSIGGGVTGPAVQS